MAKSEMESSPLNILDALSEHQDFHSSIFLTYGADLTFFEDAILPILWDKGCRHNLIFMDGERYIDTVNDLRGSISKIGHRYLVVPIRLGRFQSFHPKLVLFLGIERARLLVGSGNLTFTGYGHNHEVFTCVDWTPDQPEWQYLCTQAWQVIRTIMQKWGHSQEARNMLHTSEQLSPWITHSPQVSTEIQLLHSLDIPLLEQIEQALDGANVQKITVVVPFLDEQAAALNALYEHFRPTTLQLVLQDHHAVGNITTLGGLLKSGNWLKIHHFCQVDENQRYLHAKIYIFETDNVTYAVTGSANCSQVALLSSSTQGNIEIVLLRKANNHEHFADLLKHRVNSQSITNLDNLSLKPPDMPPPGLKGEKVQLFDVSIENGMFCASLMINALPDGIVGLQFRISTTPPQFIPLEAFSSGPHSIKVAIADDLQKVLARPQSVSIWGLDSTGQPVDMDCNEHWITHVDILRFEMARVTRVDIDAGERFTDGSIESESEWRDLYETLTKLIELDVAQLKRKKGGYSSQKSDKKTGGEQKSQEKETQILLVDTFDEDETVEQREIEETIFKESDFARWFEYIRARLASVQGEDTAEADPDDIDNPDEQTGANSTNGNKKNRTGRKWTPSQRESRRFINLVRKYITSLNNDEYMQIASIHQKVTYYIVFQRITWLLLEHKVIDTASFIDLICQINAGLFGSPNEDPPVLCPRLRPHLRLVWHQEWEAYEMAAYVLASLFMVNQLVLQIKDEGLLAQTKQQSIWVLAGLTSVVGPPKFAELSSVYSQLAAWYRQDEVDLVLQAEENYMTRLADINQLLDHWSQMVTIALENINDMHLRKLLLQAKIDYNLARFCIFEILQDIEKQTELCSQLISWMRFAGDLGGVRQFTERLVLLLQAQGLSHDAAVSLFAQGVNLFLSGKHSEAAAKLNQASILAEQINDDPLLKRCKQYLNYTEFFLGTSGQIQRQ